MWNKLLFIFLGGGLGCVLRFLISKGVHTFYKGAFPWATFVSNALSCLLVAALVYGLSLKGATQEKALYFFAVVGFCGGLSTFSTFSFETFELLKQGHVFWAVLNVLGSVAVGLVCIYFWYKQSTTI